MTTNAPLASKYRPRFFSDLVGQNSVSLFLQNMADRGTIPQGILMTGPHGVGKTSTARIVAAALNCEPDDVNMSKPCGKCSSCADIESGQSLSVIEIDAASNSGVEDVRKLADTLRYQAGGLHRVVILDEVQSMSKAAFNALLKPLEESTTHFILLTTEPEKILNTVKSRLIEFQFRKVSPSDILDRLVAIDATEGYGLPVDLLQFIADRSDGALRDAIMSLDKAVRAGVTSMQQFAKMSGHVDAGPKLLAIMHAGDVAKTFDFVTRILQITGDPHRLSSQLIETLRDLLIIKTGGALQIEGTAAENRRMLASRLDVATIVRINVLLWDLKTKIRPSDDPRGSLDLAIMMIIELLSRGKTAPTAPAPAAPVQASPSAPPKKLSLADMK